MPSLGQASSFRLAPRAAARPLCEMPSRGFTAERSGKCWWQRHGIASLDGRSARPALLRRRRNSISTSGWALHCRFPIGRTCKIAERTGPADLSAHHENFLDCIRDTTKAPAADVMAGHRAATLVHLANIGARTGRAVNFDPQAESITGDEEAAMMVGRRYRDGHWAAPQAS
jgi:hypothetical protein